MLTDPKALKSGRESQIGTKWPLSNARIKQYPQRIEHITRPNVDKAKMANPKRTRESIHHTGVKNNLPRHVMIGPSRFLYASPPNATFLSEKCPGH